MIVPTSCSRRRLLGCQAAGWLAGAQQTSSAGADLARAGSWRPGRGRAHAHAEVNHHSAGIRRAPAGRQTARRGPGGR